MAFDSLGRYVPNHKGWDHVGNLLPVVEYSEGERPHGEFKPAAWLPTQFFDKYYEVYYCVLPGKILAADNDGRIVPAQYGLPGATITYAATDVTAGVIDVRTGSTLLTANIGTFTVSGVTDFMGNGEQMLVSPPLGVAPYGYFQWAGDGSSNDDGFNPVGFREHNHNLQHRVALLCDYVLELPHVPAVVTAEALAQGSYDADTDIVTFTAVSDLPVAANTVRTEITLANNTKTDAATRFVRQQTDLADVTSAGDWHINLTTGVVSAFASVDPAGGATAYSITYYTYFLEASSGVSAFACVVGNVKVGDFLQCDANSNFRKADSVDGFSDVMGQVLEIENVLDKDALSKVRTAYPSLSSSATGTMPAYAGQLDQMPGSATGGVTDKVHYAGAADKVVRVNLISR